MSVELQTELESGLTSRNRARIVFLALTFVFLILLALVGAYQLVHAYSLPVDVDNNESLVIKIPRGASSAAIGKLLEEKGLIKDERFFLLYVRFNGMDTALKSGEYQLSAALSLEEIVEKLASGKVTNYKFTVPEGLTVDQTAELWEQKGFGSKESFISAASSEHLNYLFLSDAPSGTSRLEGFLFPETYTIPAGTTADDIVKIMLDQFNGYWDKNKQEIAEQMGLSARELVTLASIIEKEAKLDEERRTISAVFHNRVKIGMPLQSCATIQYILGEPKAVLLEEDLKIPSPYNTYLHSGLPPGPIASPGRASLDAGLNPEQVNYLYFVTKGDGSHAFATTLKAHNSNKRKYLK